MGNIKYSALKRQKEAGKPTIPPAQSQQPPKEEPPNKRRRLERKSGPSLSKKTERNTRASGLEVFAPRSDDEESIVDLDTSDDEDYLNDEPPRDDAPQQEQTNTESNLWSMKGGAKWDGKFSDDNDESSSEAALNEDFEEVSRDQMVQDDELDSESGNLQMVRPAPRLTATEVINKVAFGNKARGKLLPGANGPVSFEATAEVKAKESAKKLMVQLTCSPEAGDEGDFAQEYLAQRVQASATTRPETLMQEADEFFSEHNKQEKVRTKAAMKRLKDMKAVNKKGGDKDGFRYVLPKNHKELIRLEAMKTGQELGPGEDEEKLKSHYLGDGVDETDKKPMRKNKRKAYYFDDFYEHQKLKKWTSRAESFLQRTRFASKAKHVRMQGKRGIKKL